MTRPNKGLSLLAPGGGKMRDSGNKVVSPPPFFLPTTLPLNWVVDSLFNKCIHVHVKKHSQHRENKNYFLGINTCCHGYSCSTMSYWEHGSQLWSDEDKSIYNNYSMSPSWICCDKITNKRVVRVVYNHFISNKGEWNNCFSKLSNRVLPRIFISAIIGWSWKLRAENF